MAFDEMLAAERQRLAAQAPQAPAYQFRDDRNAALKNDAATTAASIKADPFKAGGTAGPFAPAETSGFSAFSKDLEAGAPTAAKPSGSNPFAPADTKAQVNGAISRLLQSPTKAFDQQSAIARENAVTGNQVQNEDLRTQAALSFLPGTGQGFTPLQKQSDQQMLAMRGFDQQTAAGHSQAEQAGLQAGIGAGQAQQGIDNNMKQFEADLGLRTAGQAENSRQFNESLALNAANSANAAALGQSDLTLREKSLSQSASQFQDQLSFQKDSLAKGYTEAEAARAWQSAENSAQRASSEKVAFADLSVREKQLAQAGAQFQDQLSFQKYALAQGYTEAETARAWQSTQNQAQIASSEKIAMADLSVREKTLAQSANQFQDQLAFQKDSLAKGFTENETQRAWQAAQAEKAQTFQGDQAAKDREQANAQFYESLGLSKEKLALDKTLGLGNLSIAQQQVANQASQFATEDEFKRYALQKGLDADSAKLAWQSNESEIQRKWTSGERMSSEEFTSLVNKSQQTFEAAQNSLNRTLQLDVQGNSQKFEAAQTAAAQAYDAAKTDKGMSHEDALAASTQAFQKEMQAAGFTNEQALQAAQLSQQANIAKSQMELQSVMHMADLAQSDKQFGQKMGLDYAQLDQQASQFSASLAENAAEFAKTFGLNESQVNAALKSDEFKSELEKVQIGMQLSKDNPDAAKLFAKSLASTMGKALGLSPEDIAKGAAFFEESGGTASTVTGGSGDALQAAKDSVDTVIGSLPASVNADKVKAELAATVQGGKTKVAALALGNMPGADVNVWGGSMKTAEAMKPTQAAWDYLGFYNLVKMGVPESTAADLLTKTLGADRFKASYKALTGKDFA